MDVRRQPNYNRTRRTRTKHKEAQTRDKDEDEGLMFVVECVALICLQSPILHATAASESLGDVSDLHVQL